LLRTEFFQVRCCTRRDVHGIGWGPVLSAAKSGAANPPDTASLPFLHLAADEAALFVGAGSECDLVVSAVATAAKASSAAAVTAPSTTDARPRLPGFRYFTYPPSRS